MRPPRVVLVGVSRVRSPAWSRMASLLRASRCRASPARPDSVTGEHGGQRMKTFNLYSDEWDATREREGWRVKGTLVGQHIGGELIGATMSEVEPGSKLWPYHTHYLNEEWVIVLRGEPTLRTPEGEHVLKEGDVVCFPRGKDGAHQIINGTDSSIRVLMLSSMIPGEIIEYLDTGKVLAKDIEDENIMFARPGPTVEYWEGED